MGEAGHEKRRILLWIGLREEVGSVPEAAQLLIFCRSTGYTIVKPRKTLVKVSQNVLVSETRTDILGRGWQRKGGS